MDERLPSWDDIEDKDARSVSPQMGMTENIKHLLFNAETKCVIDALFLPRQRFDDFDSGFRAMLTDVVRDA